MPVESNHHLPDKVVEHGVIFVLHVGVHVSLQVHTPQRNDGAC